MGDESGVEKKTRGVDHAEPGARKSVCSREQPMITHKRAGGTLKSSIIVPILIMFFLTLAITGFANHTHQRKPFFTRIPRWTFNYKPLGWTLMDYLAATTSVSILGLIYLLLFEAIQIKVPKFLALVVIGCICTCTVGMATLYFNLVDTYKKISTPLTIISTTATIFIAVISSILADGHIERLTGVEAGKFPNAQKAMILTSTVIIWASIIFVASALFTTASSIYLFWKTGPGSSINLNQADDKGRTPFHAFNLLIGITFFFGILSGAYSTAINDLSERRLKYWLVGSSFHFAPEHCGIREKPMDSQIALIGDGKAVLATSSLTEIYRFDLIACPQASEPKPTY
ncbi:hypothetical protein [Pseudomonas syringae]|uniref:Uncharacterized protein n=1 Tax=Pseudomonas syringae pv. syringae (strain B728a) TaxID=205918 RepID=Q4ZW70_PSEU2|nr:hypothetical protein [Pseudomonas syringae]AAY36602.1 hypothetical protein Psyr_1554 [Pseudomonas syringae pv. syringae B728a]PYD17509.1 hypothetical protein DND47_07875 [Pseudomonas syringae pv. syringae]